MSKIGKPYDPQTRDGVIGRNFNGQFYITFRGAKGFCKDKKFNLYMGAGALGGAFSDLAGDNFGHRKNCVTIRALGELTENNCEELILYAP